MKAKKVLIVEDDKLLATTFGMFIDELGYINGGLALNGEDALEICSKVQPDIVLMDIHLPGEIDGIAATERIQHEFDIPVIYITSDTNETTVKRAVETHSYGYLIKPVDKASLGIAIESAMSKHLYDKELAVSEKRYRVLVEDSPNGVIVLGNDYKIQYSNYSGLKLLGTIHLEDVIARNFLDYFDENDKEILMDKIREGYETYKRIDYFPLMMNSIQGRQMQIGIVGSIIEFAKQNSIQLIITDHTECIVSKSIINKHGSIIESIKDGIILLTTEGIISLWNKGAEEIFGKKSSEVINESFTNTLQLDERLFLDSMLTPVTEKGIHTFDYRVINNLSGASHLLRFSLSGMKDEEGSLSGIICYCYDYTNRIEFEQKLRESEANLKAIFNGGTEAIYVVDKEYRILNYNKLAIQYAKTMFNRDLFNGVSVFDIVYFLNKSELVDLFSNALEGVAHYLERLIRFDKLEKYLKINIYPVFNEGEDSIDRFCISFLDITERKKVEKDLDDARNELKPMFDSSIQRFYLLDLNYRLLSFNKAAQDVIQREFNKTLKKGDNIFDYVPKDTNPVEFKNRIESARKGNHIVYKQKNKVGNEQEFNEVHLEPIISEKGEIYRILLWTLDTTETEKNLVALALSEERYALVAKGGNDGLWDWDMTNDEVYLSPRWKTVLGYDENEYISREDARQLFIHPDDVEQTKENLKKHLKGETDIYINEYRLKHKNGEYRWILERGLALRDEEGNPYRMAGTITDITDNKSHENELKALNQMLLEERSMFIRGNVVVFRLDAKNFSNISYLSDNVEDVLGYSMTEFAQGKVSLTDIIIEEDRDMHRKERDEAMKKNATHLEFSVYGIRKKNGDTIYVKDFISILRDESGEAVEFLGYFIDVTKEKLAEKSLIDNQQKYFALFSQANDAILIIDKDKIVDCNSKSAEILGYTREEMLEIDILKLSPEVQPSGTPSAEKRARKIQDAYEGKYDTFYWQYCRKNGELFDAEVSLTMVELNGKRYLHAIVRDISDRKKIEKDLRTSEQKYRRLLDAIPDTIFIFDKDGNYLNYKPDVLGALAIEKEKIIGKNLKDFFSGDEEKEFRSKINKALEGKSVESIRYNLDSPNGIRNFEARISMLSENKVFVIVRDFTDKDR